MFVMREVMRCKPGRVRDLKGKFKALNAVITSKNLPPFAIMTDVAGEHFWTLVLETEAESISAFFTMEEQVMTDKEAQRIMEGYHELVIEGRREVFRKET